MSSHENLYFFNKQGDALNFRYDENQQIFQGDILFDENSTDTFKTYALYTLEKVPSFTFESPGDLGTNKFQLFNEHGLHFYGCTNSSNQQILKIEPVNNDPDFFSKWIYGEHFEVKYPIGTLIVFNSILFEFTNTNQTYVVVGTKKGAILIISNIDNATFESMYYNQYNDSSFFTDKLISGIDAIGIYDYIDTEYVNNLSIWSEPNFYDKLYKGKKLNVVNTSLNDGNYTVKGPEITDIISFEYLVNKNNLPQDSNLIIEVILGTDLPKMYDGGLTITNNNRIYITDYIYYPRLLNSGQEFKVVGSINNENFFTVASLENFSSNITTHFYDLDDQVLYNDILYQCILAYTHSQVDDSTRFITPNTDSVHWSSPTYIGVNESTISESLLSAQLYLTKGKYYYDYIFTESSEVTMSSAVEKYKDDLSIFNIDLYYKDNYLKADLIYPSNYAKVNFYHTQVGTTYSIGTTYKSFERLIEVNETLQSEFNYDYSENFKFNIVFTDLDEYGLKIVINEMIYEEQIAWVYSGVNINLVRTIDRTLRNWLTRNYITLYKLGINVELQYSYIPGSPLTSLFFNSILIQSEYPNVPINVSQVLVGSTADYYIEHSKVLFNSLGPTLNININNKDYIVQSTKSTLSSATFSIFDITKTLKSWVDLYSADLLEYGFIISNINSILTFNIKQTDTPFNYSISTGQLNLPGLNNYTITRKLKGNQGSLITSNEVILSATSSSSFELEGFATGMVFSINNTYWPLINQEYNIEFLDPKVLNLSYQGPFWDVNNFICDKSPFVTIAFNLGFGQTGCGIIGSTGNGGQFYQEEFNNQQFNMVFYPNSYEISDYPSTTNLVDIKYIQLSNSIYSFGDDISINDSYFGTYLQKIILPGNIDSIKMEFNTVNSYLYCLSKNKVWIVDPSTHLLITSINLSYNAFDLQINPDNGDVYITYSNATRVDIFTSNSFTSPHSIVTLSSNTGKLVYNEFEKYMYITSDSDSLFVIDGDTRLLKTSYNIPGLLISTIFYEPINSSIFAYSSSYLYKIDDGNLIQTSFISDVFNEIIFNNLTGEMNVSDSSNQFSRISLDGDIIKQSNVANYGYMEINQYDGGVYISSQTSNSVVVIDSITAELVYLNALSAPTTKLVYNPDRKSIWAIQPSLNQIVEILVELNTQVTTNPIEYNNISDNMYGTLAPDFEERSDIWLKTRDYFRKPRENFEGDTRVEYYWKWYADNVSEFFMYDFSGDQLYRETTGSYSYIGTKPLSTVVLNRNPNKDVSKISLPEYQQTIFNKVEYTLNYIDDSVDISTSVEPLQLFIGFQSQNEGALRSILQLYKKESISFTIPSTPLNNAEITLQTLDINTDNKRGLISIGLYSNDSFYDRGLKAGQHIVIYLKDNTNLKNQYISYNNGTLVKIKEVYAKSIVVDFFNLTTDILESESSIIVDYPKTGETTYLDFTIKVVDKEIGRFFTYGQTEDEDERFKIELGNVGKLVSPEDIFIFKQYDIEEGGVDWTYLNKKRKEMLMMKHLIYPYIGSYVSIINAINFFGYNDLQLNEYYKNVDPSSVNFTKLFKVEIPDIFDNTVEGWTENDFIKHTMPNDNFEVTNMFNLTYFITDKEGNNELNYTLDEIIIKLQGLKYWLKKNIIPLTHKILDITGRAFFSSGTQIQHRLHDVQIMNIRDNMTPIYTKLSEAYLMPVNSGSTVYNCVLDFYTIIPNIGADKTKSGLIVPPSPFNGKTLTLPDYFNIRIRTYKTYKEWAPFTTYFVGDKVIYYGKIYESVINDNKVRSPRKYELVTPWLSGQTYDLSSIVEYNRDIYVFKINTSISIVVPLNDSGVDGSWDKITEWKEIDWEPVQTLHEYRKGDNLLPFNFTIDSNIDPFITIEVTSDNGYGVYRDKKNYEIRGLKDLQSNNQNLDPIGPFIPIKAKNNTLDPSISFRYLNPTSRLEVDLELFSSLPFINIITEEP
jgi:hypothetical protein